MAHLEDAGISRAVQPAPAVGIKTAGSRNLPWLKPALFWLLVLLAWELAARSSLISPLFFPPPTKIMVTSAQMLMSGKLTVDLGYTLFRLTLGLALGGSLGLFLGLLMGWSDRVRGIAEPVVAATHPLPKLALLPLALIIFGIGESSKVVLIALAAFFPMVINSMAGVRQIDKLTWEVVYLYRARGWIIFRRVIWPGSLPLVLTGLQLALNAALLVTVSVELLSARQGLGATIWLAWQTLRTEELYATLLVIALVGLSSNKLLNWATLHLLPWQATPAPRDGK